MKFNLFLLLLLIGNSVFSQDIKPGKTASGLTDYKANTSVDYPTGILNYNIPLFTAETDGFSLPIVLSYNAGGIKVDDAAGPAGLGWSLNFGAGTIGRTLRGMTADEDPLKGLLNTTIPAGNIGTPAFDNYVEQVNSSKVDGESDIFTLNIQGGSVKFILVKNGTTVGVKSLEKTDVLIQPIINESKITGWTVKDGSGNIYDFVAAKPGNVVTAMNTPASTYYNNVSTSWYVKRITLFNHKEINFVYQPEEYAEQENQGSSHYVVYSPAMRVPNLSDPDLRAQLNLLKSQYNNVGVEITKINNQLDFLEYNARQAAQTFRARYDSTTMSSNILNSQIVQEYNNEMKRLNQDMGWIALSQDGISTAIGAVLNKMYAKVDKTTDSFYEPNSSIFINKLLSKIILPEGEISISYQKISNNAESFYAYSNIEYKNVINEKISSVRLTTNFRGYLKDLFWTNDKDSVKNTLHFDYYMENAPYTRASLLNNTNAQDYWGYFNGKNSNTGLFPEDTGYLHTGITSVGYATVFFGYLNSREKNDRHPYLEYTIARSLKSVSSDKGTTTAFEYEGNEIFAADINKNIPMGGLRIKNVTVSHGEKKSVTSYKYAFEMASNPGVLRSAGRLNEWAKKVFSWTYYFLNGGMDEYLYAKPVYIGKLYNDNSNNGVLYHYVEEIRPDNSVIGYKYPEVPSEYYSVIQNPYLDHNSQLDRALLAKIYYSASGKIVKIERNKYSYPLQYLVNRQAEFDKLQTSYPYFVESGSLQPELIRQVKKEPVHFNHNALIESYPDKSIPSYDVHVGKYYYSLNPYNSYYLPNYPQREIHYQLATIYDMQLESALLLKEREILTFDDYDLNAFHSASNPTSLPNEKPYEFDRLMRYNNARRLSSVTTYAYDPLNYVYPVSVTTRDSKNKITVLKKKYVADYNLPVPNAVEMMKQLHRLNEVVESQEWKSDDNGSSFKLANGVMNEYEEQQINGKSYILPIKKHILNFSQPINPSSLGYAESYVGSGSYTTQFWENKNLFTPEESYSWNIVNSSPKITQIMNRANMASASFKFNQLTGDKILECYNTKSVNVAATDLGPIIKHKYYADKFGRFNTAHSYQIDSTITYAYLSTLPFTSLIYNYSVPAKLDFFKLATDAKQAMNDLAYNYPSDFYLLLQYPLFIDFYNIFTCIAEDKSEAEFSEYINKAYYDFTNAFYYAQNYWTMVGKMHNANPHAMWYIVDNMIKGLKNDYSKRPPYIDLDNYHYQFFNKKKLKAFINPRLEITVDVDVLAKRYVDLYILLTPENIQSTISVGVTATYIDGSTSFLSFTLANSQCLVKKTFDIQSFANYQNIKTLSYTSDYNTRYAVMLPSGSEFKAYAYLPDGKSYFTFDQTLKATEVFYDALGDYHYVKNEKDEILSMAETRVADPSMKTNKMVKIIITNSYRLGAFDMNYKPKIISLQLNDYSNSSTWEAYYYDVNIYPGQIKVIEAPALNYHIKLSTEYSNYIIKINNVVVPNTYDGVSNYILDTTNLKEVNIDLIQAL